MAAVMHRTAGTPTDIDKCTWSLWLKRGSLTTTSGECFFGTPTAPGYIQYRFGPTATTNQIRMEAGGVDGGAFEYLTNRLFRDTNAWYHIVIAQDSTQSVAADRVKLYINGVQETSFATQTNWQLNSGIPYNASGAVQYVGSYDASSTLFAGCMSHFHFIDGTQYAASDFGSFDATSGIWKIKTAPSVTYGNNGFFLKMEDRTNLDLDSSPNAHTFTTTGTITPTYDNPSNNFATLNPLDRHIRDTNNSGDFLGGVNGNLTLDSTSGMWAAVRSTLGVTSGKWYWEVKRVSGTADLTGICYGNWFWNATGNQPWDNAYYQCADMSIHGGTGNYNWSGRSGDTTTNTGVSASTGDILGYALDMDNSALYVHLNGTYFDGVGSTPGVPTSGATKTGDMLGLLDATNGVKYVNYGQEVFPVFADVETGNTAKVEVNFGNGYFGTTSTGTTEEDDAGIGQFKYDVPAGYYALCTKNIKAYGG